MRCKPSHPFAYRIKVFRRNREKPKTKEGSVTWGNNLFSKIGLKRSRPLGKEEGKCPRLGGTKDGKHPSLRKETR